MWICQQPNELDQLENMPYTIQTTLEYEYNVSVTKW